MISAWNRNFYLTKFIFPGTTASGPEKRNGKVKRMGGKIKSPNGLERGLVPEKVLGATQNEKGELLFLVKWKNTPEVASELLPKTVLYTKYPSLVLEFYEANINWKDWNRPLNT